MQIEFGVLVEFNSCKAEKNRMYHKLSRKQYVNADIECEKVCHCRMYTLNSYIHIKYGAHLALFRLTAFGIRYRIIAQNNNSN